MTDEWVEITHPEVGDADNPVTRKAFEQVWSKQDPPWQLKGEVPEPQSRLARNQPKPEGDK